MKKKLFMHGFDNVEILMDEDHIYTLKIKDQHYRARKQISITGLIGEHKDFTWHETNYEMLLAIYKKVCGKSEAYKMRQWVMKLKEINEEYTTMKARRGTIMHEAVENGKIDRLESLINKLKMYLGPNQTIIREQRMYLYTEGDYYDLPGTIDLLMIDNDTKEVILCDWKFSNMNKKPLLEKQLNLYATLLSLRGYVVKKLVGVTIKSTNEITVHNIERKEFDIDSEIISYTQFN